MPRRRGQANRPKAARDAASEILDHSNLRMLGFELPDGTEVEARPSGAHTRVEVIADHKGEPARRWVFDLDGADRLLELEGP